MLRCRTGSLLSKFWGGPKMLFQSYFWAREVKLNSETAYPLRLILYFSALLLLLLNSHKILSICLPHFLTCPCSASIWHYCKSIDCQAAHTKVWRDRMRMRKWDVNFPFSEFISPHLASPFVFLAAMLVIMSGFGFLGFGLNLGGIFFFLEVVCTLRCPNSIILI